MHTYSIGRTLPSLRAAGLAMLLTGAMLGANRAEAQSHAVFTSTNAVAGNSVLMFSRAQDGTLTPVGSTFTGGLGTGAGLGSQGALALSSNGKWLFAVNAGSNDISVFSVNPNRVKLVGRTPSGGTTPISVTSWGNRLYVLNAGTPNNITGFTVGAKGALTPIPNSTQSLSTASAGPAQVSFDPFGALLVVTEKGTNTIDVFPVDSVSGAAGPAVSSPSFGTTPFGFGFDPQGRLYVSEAFGGAAGASAVSSYFVSSYGILPITGSAQDGQSAACWIAVGRKGSAVWTTNAHSNNLSGYGVWPNGTLNLLSANGGIVATAGPAPTDMAQDAQQKYLYVLEAGVGAVAEFSANWDGTLNPLGTTASFGSGYVGLAAW